MEQWNNLKEYFGSKFSNITFLDVILYVEIPLIVTFIDKSKYYICYLYKFDDSTFNAYWLISETTNKELLELIDGHISVNDIMIQNKQKCYCFSVKDGHSNLEEKRPTNFEISSEFYITKNTPNEIDLLKVKDSITDIAYKQKQFTTKVYLNDLYNVYLNNLYADTDYSTDKHMHIYKNQVQDNMQSEKNTIVNGRKVINHDGWHKLMNQYLDDDIDFREYKANKKHVKVKYKKLKEIDMTVEENIYVES